MTDDQPFKVVLTLALLVVLPIGIYHRVKSEATREKLDRRQEGVFILATLRPAGAAFWLATIAWMIDPRWMAWASLSLPVWVRWMGVGLVLVAGALLVWTFRSLGTNLTDTVVTRRTHTLVVHGPYRWIRHPFYDSAALLMTAISLITANWFLVLTAMATFGLLVLRTRIEEEKLVARFGDSYRQYVARTGRFLPRLLLAVLVATWFPATPQLQTNSVAEALAKAEATWSHKKPAAYEFTIDVRCYCALSPAPPSFRVKAGVATAISELTATRRQEYEFFDSIEKLFAILDRSLARKPEKMAVEFEPVLGYPVWAAIDPRKDTYDDELTFTILNFKPLTGRTVRTRVLLPTGIGDFVE